MSTHSSKKQRTLLSTARTASSLSSLPKEVLALIVELVDEDDAGCDDDAWASLPLLASTCKTLHALALPLVFDAIDLEDASDLVRVVRLFKGGKKGRKSDEDSERGNSLGVVEELAISLPTLYAASPTQSNLLSSLSTLLLTPTTLTFLSLSLGLPSSPAHHPLRAVLPSFPHPLDTLTSLRSFDLSAGAELWLHDLAVLLSSWPALDSLEVAHLRGECHSHARLDAASTRPKLVRLVVRSSSLTGEMVAWLLDGQDGLKELELPLPGDGSNAREGERAWRAVEKVVEGVEELRVWNAWAATGAAGTKKKKKAEAEAKKEKEVERSSSVAGGSESGDTDHEDDDDALSDIFEHPASPLLPLVSKATNLRSLLLLTSHLPSAPSPESFELLLPHLEDLESLTFEDNASSGLRRAVQDAIEGRKLMWLERVTSVKGKKRKPGQQGDPKKKSPADKKFEAMCAKHGVEWTVSEE
ncbi:hypothetical protein JCM8097_001967 [Rhodosporidiobolus ruineniae]